MSTDGGGDDGEPMGVELEQRLRPAAIWQQASVIATSVGSLAAAPHYATVRLYSRNSVRRSFPD